MVKLTINCDGGARGNPGPAGIGILIEKDKQDNRDNQDNQVKISKHIGTATNNQAEYKAVIEALNWIIDHRSQFTDDLEIEFFLDSQLVVEQLNQRYKLKNEGLKPLFWEIRELIMKIGGRVLFKYIPREENKEAD